jgi:hypothetical protein
MHPKQIRDIRSCVLPKRLYSIVTPLINHNAQAREITSLAISVFFFIQLGTQPIRLAGCTTNLPSYSYA